MPPSEPKQLQVNLGASGGGGLMIPLTSRFREISQIQISPRPLSPAPPSLLNPPSDSPSVQLKIKPISDGRSGGGGGGGSLFKPDLAETLMQTVFRLDRRDDMTSLRWKWRLRVIDTFAQCNGQRTTPTLPFGHFGFQVMRIYS